MSKLPERVGKKFAMFDTKAKEEQFKKDIKKKKKDIYIKLKR